MLITVVDHGEPSTEKSETFLQQRDDVLTRSFGDVAVLLNPGSECDPLILRGTAREIWDHFSSPRRLSDVVTSLVTLYSAEPAELEADVSAVLLHLKTAALLRELDQHEDPWSSPA